MKNTKKKYKDRYVLGEGIPMFDVWAVKLFDRLEYAAVQKEISWPPVFNKQNFTDRPIYRLVLERVKGD